LFSSIPNRTAFWGHATSQKVPGMIPDEVTEFFNGPNPSNVCPKRLRKITVYCREANVWLKYESRLATHSMLTSSLTELGLGEWDEMKI
jgi:hypothetical protein